LRVYLGLLRIFEYCRGILQIIADPRPCERKGSPHACRMFSDCKIVIGLLGLFGLFGYFDYGYFAGLWYPKCHGFLLYNAASVR
jgi:hypothetical protein